MKIHGKSDLVAWVIDQRDKYTVKEITFDEAVDHLEKEGLSPFSMDSEGKEEDVSITDYRESVKIQPVFGMIEEDGEGKWIIYIAVDRERVTLVDLIYFFGHEIGHSMTEPTKEELEEHPLFEENRADNYGVVGALAFEFAHEISQDESK